jgi:hypothetical protein
VWTLLYRALIHRCASKHENFDVIIQATGMAFLSELNTRRL